MSTFKFGWMQQRRFTKERERQAKTGMVHYVDCWDPHATSYWQDVTSVPPPNADQREILSEFGLGLVAKKPNLVARDPRKRAPEDIYPVF